MSLRRKSTPRRPAVARTFKYRHVHSSSRFDRSSTSLLRAIARYLSWPGTDISLTEVSGSKRIKVLRRFPTHRVVNFEGNHARDDCALLISRWRWRNIASGTKLLSKEAMPGWNNAWCYAVWSKDVHKSTGLRVVKVVIHFAARVEDSRGYRYKTADDRQNAKAHKEAIRNLNSQIRDWQKQGYDVVVSADWNLDWRRLWVRKMLRRELPMLNWTWGGPRMPERGGTHGTRLIDYTGTTMRIEKASLMKDDASSDHRPYKEVLSLGRQKKKKLRRVVGKA